MRVSCKDSYSWSGSSGIGIGAPVCMPMTCRRVHDPCDAMYYNRTPMDPRSADVVVGGAGIAGIAAAYPLAVRGGLTNVVIVDERPPLSLTSDKSTECYRNWWPGPGDD